MSEYEDQKRTVRGSVWSVEETDETRDSDENCKTRFRDDTNTRSEGNHRNDEKTNQANQKRLN